MTSFKSILLISLLLSISPTNADSIPRLTSEQFHKFFASQFVSDFVREFNAIKKIPEAKSAYGLLFPPKYKAAMTKWDKSTVVKADGPVLIIEVPNEKPVRLEVVDIFAQKYKINGRVYARDWNIDPLLEVEILSRKMKSTETSMMDLILPPSEAVAPIVAGAAEAGVGIVVVADVAALAMAETAVPVVASATAASAMAGATTTGTAATTAGVAAGVGGAVIRLEKMIELIAKNPEFQKKVGEAAALRQEQMIEIVKAALTTPKSSPLLTYLKSASNEVWQTAKLAGLSIFSFAAGKGMWPTTLISCMWNNSGSVEQCTSAMKAAPPPAGVPTKRATLNTCYDPKGVEVSGYYAKGEKKDFFAIQFGSVGPDGKSDPVSAISYVIGGDKKIETDSVRKYKITIDKTMPEVASFNVVKMDRINLKHAEDLVEKDIMPLPDETLTANAAIIADTMSKQSVRDTLLFKAHFQNSEQSVSPELLDEFHRNRDIIIRQTEKDQHELAIVAELTLAYNDLIGACNTTTKADPKTVSAAAVPAGDTAITDPTKEESKTKQ